MAKALTPKVKGRKRITRKKPPRAKPNKGSPGMQEVVHLRGGGVGGRLVTVTFSEDVMEHLMDTHDAKYHPLLFRPRSMRMHRIRLQFVRLVDVGIPGIMVMVEPPTYDPRGRLARQHGKRYSCTISARRIGLIDHLPRRDPEWYYADNMQGLIIPLEDEDVSGDPPPRRQRGDPIDLVAR